MLGSKLRSLFGCASAPVSRPKQQQQQAMNSSHGRHSKSTSNNHSLSLPSLPPSPMPQQHRGIETIPPITSSHDYAGAMTEKQHKRLLEVSQNKDLYHNGDELRLFIVDFDDTLLASTHLAKHGVRLDSPEQTVAPYRKDLQELARTVCLLLTLLKSLGRVVIVTNAEKGWVELSTNKYIPSVLPMYEGVEIISARTQWESQYPKDVVMWKYASFYELTQSYTVQHDVSKSIFSFGDSDAERQALQSTCLNQPNTLAKSVKFHMFPTIAQLNGQLETLVMNLSHICRSKQHIDLQMTVSPIAPKLTPLDGSVEKTATMKATTKPVSSPVIHPDKLSPTSVSRVKQIL